MGARAAGVSGSLRAVGAARIGRPSAAPIAGVARAAGVSGALRAVPAGRLGRPSAAPIAGVTRAAGVSAGVRAGVSAGVRGVDLNLDEFSLSATKKVKSEGSAGVAFGNNFWANISDISSSVFAEKDF